MEDSPKSGEKELHEPIKNHLQTKPNVYPDSRNRATAIKAILNQTSNVKYPNCTANQRQ